MSKIPELRGQYLILNSAGLNIVGRVASVLFQNEATKEQITNTIEELAKIDWLKSGSIWQGGIVTEGSKGLKISTSNSAIKKSFEKLSETIKLDEIIPNRKKG